MFQAWGNIPSWLKWQFLYIFMASLIVIVFLLLRQMDEKDVGLVQGGMVWIVGYIASWLWRRYRMKIRRWEAYSRDNVGRVKKD